MNSQELRATLAQLTEAANQAGETLVAREGAHRVSLRRAVESGDFTLSIASERALDEARREHDRAVTARDMATQLLAEAVKREKAEEQAQARAEIEEALASMSEEARKLDTEAAMFVGRLIRLRERETELHRVAKQHFRSPWSAPQTLSAARYFATALATLANGGAPDVKAWTAEAVASGAHAVRATFDAE